MEDTRHDDQPSENFLDPINKLIEEVSSLIFLNKESEKSRSEPKTLLEIANSYSFFRHQHL